MMPARPTCPECGTILRIRDRSFVGRRVNCPECKTPLRVDVAANDSDFVFRRLTAADVTVDERQKQGKRRNSVRSDASPQTTSSSLTRTFNSPLTAICLVAIAVISLFAVLMLKPQLRFASKQPTAVQKATDPPANSNETPVPKLDQPLEDPDDTAMIVPSQMEIDETIEISALEPANTDAPLSWPPLPPLKDTVEAPDAVVAIPIPPVPIPIKIDIESKMAQKIISYQQPKVRRRELLNALQEQLGVPIRYNIDELGAASLDDKVGFELENTTLGAVIKLVADSAGWRIIMEDTGIRLTGTNSTPTP